MAYLFEFKKAWKLTIENSQQKWKTPNPREHVFKSENANKELLEDNIIE